MMEIFRTAAQLSEGTETGSWGRMDRYYLHFANPEAVTVCIILD